MPGRDLPAAMVPVQRAELVTQDLDELAGFIRGLDVEHVASFSCPEPAQAHGAARSATAGGLTASLLHCSGFTYTTDMSPVNPPTAVVCTAGSGVIATAREDLRLARGDVFLLPDRLPAAGTIDEGEYAALRIPWAAARGLAEEYTGIAPADLRFESLAPLSATSQRSFARTVKFICGQLVTSGAREVHSLLVAEMTRLAAAAFLETFPNTTMTAPDLRSPGWVTPSAVRAAAAFIDDHADQPVTLAQIAAAAGVTGRALQYAFRRHYGTSPTGYLRRVRLERAHTELQAADPASGLTVKTVAGRCGWASPSQFTVAYQRRFGVPPSHTLCS